MKQIKKGLIEQIETARDYEILDLCNRRRNLWAFSIFNGYTQLGRFKVKKPHKFNEGDLVIVEVDNDEVKSVKKDKITISNIGEVFRD